MDAATPMSMPFDLTPAAAPRDPRALRILAKTIYRELRQSGLAEHEVMAVASELLSLLAAEVRDRREQASSTPLPELLEPRG